MIRGLFYEASKGDMQLLPARLLGSTGSIFGRSDGESIYARWQRDFRTFQSCHFLCKSNAMHERRRHLYYYSSWSI